MAFMLEGKQTNRINEHGTVRSLNALMTFETLDHSVTPCISTRYLIFRPVLKQHKWPFFFYESKANQTSSEQIILHDAPVY
jgi:hypothetical protein